MNSCVRIVLLIMLAFLAGPPQVLCAEAIPRPVWRVHQLSGLTATKQNAEARRIFEHFYDDYSRMMRERLQRDKLEGWEFWVVLRPDTHNKDRPHIVVVGKLGRLTVRIASLSMDAYPGLPENARRIADESIRKVKNPMRSVLLGSNSLAK